jgi:hypothetical protein
MAPRVPPLGLNPQARPDGDVVGTQKQPMQKQQLPEKAEIRRLVAELRAKLSSNDRETALEAARLCPRPVCAGDGAVGFDRLRHHAGIGSANGTVGLFRS